MKTILASETMEIPSGVTVHVAAKVVTVEGPRGKLTRNFKHLNLDFQLLEVEGVRKLQVDAWFGTRRTMAAIRTAISHVQNLITGVTKGYRYKMRFVYAHFPINASITNSNTAIEIRNFLGEKKVRKVDMLEGVTILRSEKVKDELVLDGNDIELVSRSAALINQKCHVKNKDIRKFLDGIYVSDKGTITEDHCSVQTQRMNWVEFLKPVVAMLVFDTLFALMTALVKKALADGLNHVVFITLRQFVAAVLLAPIAYFKERNTRPRFTKEIFAYMFMNALLGGLCAQYLFFLGLSYTTATLTATFSNMTPVFTFLIAIPLQLETVDVRSKAGLAKVIGTLMSVGGATLLSLYKGAALTRTTSSVQEHSAKGITSSSSSISKERWMLGSVLLVLNCISFSLWMLLQGKLTKKYPAVFSSTAFMTSFSSMQAGVVALTTQRRLSVWLIRGNIQIIAVVFAGVGVSGIGYVLMTWCIEKKGPVFTAGFMPLIQIMAALIDLFFLHEQIFLGSAIGAALVIGGLYLLLWDAVRLGVEEQVALREGEESCHPQPQGTSISGGTGLSMQQHACAEECRTVMTMLVFDLISAVMTALVKKALEQGLNRLVLITLRQLVATLFLSPIAYFKERAGLSQYSFFYGLQYTTATYAITFANLSPVLTFLIAIALGVESLNMKSMAGGAKVLGTLTSMAGVLLLSLYKGVALTNHPSAAAAMDASASASAGGGHGSSVMTTTKNNKQWTLGTVMLLGNCLCFSLWLLLQGKLTKKYPAIYSCTAIMFFISTLQGGALTLATQRLTASAWALTNKLEIVTVIYSGVMASGVGYLIMTWCVGKRGPVFTAAFIPVIQIMVAFIDFFFLHEQLHLGSVLGSVLMILGLYLLLWGKKKDAASSEVVVVVCCPEPKHLLVDDEEAPNTIKAQQQPPSPLKL
uniref:WAT1-related protein n=1 Tax=Oryza meridionalis TaxID=40149 RepID=A0A0E0CHN4_9ORYZ